MVYEPTFYKYGKRTRQLKFKKELKKIFPQETMAAGENRFAPELNEKEVIELLENATPGSIKKATKHGLKIFQGKNFKLYFDNLSIQVSQSKTMQVETIYTFKIYLHIVTSRFFSQNKVEKICLGGVFNKTIIPLAFVGYEMIIANSVLRASLAIYHLISNKREWNSNC